ncbi:hypothetical protein [Cytobacillus oceanisediminis]|nr:hypothetical protein [Cytobacillus oceanisediminis]
MKRRFYGPLLVFSYFLVTNLKNDQSSKRVTRPSDQTGERPIADAILLLP